MTGNHSPIECHIKAVETLAAAQDATKREQAQGTPDSLVSAEFAEWQAEQDLHKHEHDSATSWLWAKRTAKRLFPDDFATVLQNDTAEVLERVVRLEQAVQRISLELSSKIAQLQNEIETAQAQRDAAIRSASRTRSPIQTRGFM